MLVPYGQADAAIHTFHAWGDQLLREHAFELGLGADIRLLPRAELIVLLREHLFELGLERYRPLGDPTRFLGALVDLFSRAKDEDLAPADLVRHAEVLAAQSVPARDDPALWDLAAARGELARAYERYAHLLAVQGVIDHSDQVALPLRLLRERPAVLERVGRRYRHLLVDELQDTNRAQLELVRLLASRVPDVTAVGDPAQSIYGFRGGLSGNVQRFAAAFESIRTIELRRNYRAAPHLVAAADRVRRQAVGTAIVPSPQQAHRRGRRSQVVVRTYQTPEDEADGVARDIAERVAAGARPSQFCVLVRSNGEVDGFVRSLRVRGIPADSGARAALFDEPAVRALVAFLRVVTDPADSIEMFALASSDPYRMSGETLSLLLSGARRRNRSLWDALRDAVAAPDERLDRAAIRSAATLVGHVRHAIEIASDRSSGEVLYDYMRRSGLLTQLARASDEDVQSARAVARFCELVRDRARLLAHDRVAFLTHHLESLDVALDGDGSHGDEDTAVRVLTVHRAKGLEFGSVYVCGLVDGRFPVRGRPPVLTLPDELVADEHDADESAVAEERRLFYVAITRARDELTLTTHSAGPRGRGRRRASSFIAEALDAPPAIVDPVSVAPDLEQVLAATPPPPAVPRDDRGPLSLSFSQLDEYLTCPERYRLRYDIGIPTPPHHALSYGSAMHAAIAAFHGAQIRGAPLSAEQLLAEYRRAWQPDGFLSREHEEARFEAGRAALVRFREDQLAIGQTPAAVERSFSFRLGRDEIRGRIDRIDIAPEGAIITDYKSSDVQDQKRADAKARDSLQLSVYALAHQSETGDLPARLRLHFVETGVVGSVAPDEARLDKARATLTDAAAAIRARSFEPRPSPFACGFCPFRSICRASAA
jgi:DNA helicase II / ATP-dependent DNA helicase PcrA